MSVLGLGDHSFRGKVALPAALAGIAALPDESMVFCTDATSPQLWSVAMNGLRVGRPIWLSGHTRGVQVVRVSPDGSLLLVIGNHEPVITLLETGSGRQRSVKVGTKPMDGAFHPDGRTFLICNEGEGTLAEIVLNDGGCPGPGCTPRLHSSA